LTAPTPTLRSAYPRVYRKAAGNMTCNICRRTSTPLTEDHVPPRSCLTDLVVQLEPFEHRLRAKGPRLQVSQSGVRFKTICGECNSLLGRRYDPELARFCKAACGSRSSLAGRPSTWNIWCKPDLIIRAVFGHLLAATTDDASTTDDDVMRPLVLDARRSVGPELRLYYWLYTHSSVRILRSVAMPAARSGSRSVGIFSILKFAPMGFLVTDLASYEGLPCLNDRLRHRSTSDVGVRLDIIERHEEWPERVEDGNFVMGGRSLEDAVAARPWQRRDRPKGG
jgi:hypothetical protein